MTGFTIFRFLSSSNTCQVPGIGTACGTGHFDTYTSFRRRQSFGLVAFSQLLTIRASRLHYRFQHTSDML
jgi:hypothetical protein